MNKLIKIRLNFWLLLWNAFCKNPSCVSCTMPRNNKSTLLHTYVCTEHIFDSLPFLYNKPFLKKTLIEFCSPHLYASFGTFCVQIGQFNLLSKCMCNTWVQKYIPYHTTTAPNHSISHTLSSSIVLNMKTKCISLSVEAAWV